DPETGGPSLETIHSTLPPGFTGENHCSEIALHPSGRFVYAANRGHDSIAIFAVGTEGELNRIELADCGGRNPRHFAISADGQWLVCGHLDSGSAASFGVDATTGRLTAAQRASVPGPMCILFR